MKKSDVLKQKRAALELELKSLLDGDLNAEQKKAFDEKSEAIEALDGEIAREEKREMFQLRQLGAGKNLKAEADGTAKSFSFVKFFREATEGKLTGLEAEMHQEGVREMEAEIKQSPQGHVIPRMVLRASTGQNIATPGDGGNLTKVLPMMYLDALRNALILPSLGTSFLSGLDGTFTIAKGGLFTSTWAAEGAPIDSQKAAFTKITMAAKRLTATGAFSLELLRQASIDIENWVRQGLVNANAQALLSAAISGSGSGGQPIGILNTSGIGSVPGGTDGATPTWKNMVDLESKVANANADLGRLAYVTNSKVRGILKQALKASNVPGYVWDNDGMNGYKCGVTNACPSTLVKGGSGAVASAIIFGNWEDLMIGDWGGLDIIVDPYTLKKQGDIEITVHTFADIAVARAESFAAMKDALTA